MHPDHMLCDPGCAINGEPTQAMPPVPDLTAGIVPVGSQAGPNSPPGVNMPEAVDLGESNPPPVIREITEMGSAGTSDRPTAKTV